MISKTIQALVSVVSAVLLTSCGDPVERITVSGSTTVLPAVSKAAQQYQSETGRIVVVNAGGSGSGFNQVAQGLTQIGMMSRDITEVERQQFNSFEFESIAIGRDAVVPVVSSEIYEAGVTRLSFEDITKIYAGEIDNWSEFGGPDQAIFVIDKEKSSGTRQTFFKYVAGDKNFVAPGADLVIGSNNEEQTAVTQSDAAIGMLSLAWLNDDVKGLAVQTVSGRDIQPSLKTIRSGEYPITRNLDIVLRNDASELTQDFVDYLLSVEGQKFVESSGYVPVKKTGVENSNTAGTNR